MPNLNIFNEAIPQYGWDNVKDRIWTGDTLLNIGPEQLNPTEEWSLDPNLPNLGVQPTSHGFEMDNIVIPRGRLVGVVRRTMGAPLTNGQYIAKPTGAGGYGGPLVTFADGANVPFQGFTYKNILVPQTANRPTQIPSFHRTGYVEFPYIAAVNDSYGVLGEGDYITGYFGSTTDALVPVYDDMGKPVKWIEKSAYCQQAAASASVVLSAANLPGVVPIPFMAFNAGTAVTGAATLAWSKSVNKWVATYGAAVTTIYYTFGQSNVHKAGQIVRMKQVSNQAESENWLRWAESNYQNTLFPPMAYDYPTLKVGADANGNLVAASGETPTATQDGGVFLLSQNKIAPHKKIFVYITTGSVINPDGTLTDISGTSLALRTNTWFENYAIGQYYHIDFIKGILFLSDQIRNPDGTVISAANIKVAYEYSSSYNWGKATITGYGVGIRGQTDGRYTGLPGVPASLELAAQDRRFSFAAGNFGAMRVMFN